jgi:site-specific recombinase XerD
MLVSDAIAEFLKHRRGKNVTPATLAQYERVLSYWQAWRVVRGLPPDLGAVTASDFLDYLTYLTSEHVSQANTRQQKGLSANSVASAHRVLRTFWRWADTAELLTPEQVRFFSRGRIPAPHVPEEPRPTYDAPTFARMLAAAQQPDPELCYRDQAILCLFKDSGLRVSELCGLRDEDVEADRRRARVVGKGRKHGFVFWGDDTAYALERYVQFRGGPPGGWLFRGAGSRNTGGQMTPVAVRRMFRRLAERAGVTLPRGAPVHALRHTFAHEALDAGIDISQVSQLLRHSNVETTMRYLREDPEALQEIYQRIHRDS